MKRTHAALLLLLACTFGETPEPPGPTAPTDPPAEVVRHDNRPACQAFVAHVNALACVPDSAELVVDLVCAESMSEATCDATAFWSCVTDRTRCEAGRLSRDGVETCPDPCGSAIP